jgi:predicted glycoside hydrolase/deacetylase ChbG (UPF0249 family)
VIDLRLIVNADDFGQSPGINRGVADAHERGIVTSASLMVRWPAAVEAAAYAHSRPRLSVGLHVDLGEWVVADGIWRQRYAVAALDDADAVRDEIARQVLCFRELMGRDPTHIDSHQHVHRREPVRSALAAVASALAVPLREVDQRVRYSGAFYGQTAEGHPLPDAIAVPGLIQTLEALPSGITELGCHPGYAEDLDTMYRWDRAREVATLCDPSVPKALGRLHIQLISFKDLNDAFAEKTP